MVPQRWQENDGKCHCRHSWQVLSERTITDMTVLVLISTLVVAAAAAFGTFELFTFVRQDGYGLPTRSHRPPASHRPDVFDPWNGPRSPA